MNVGAAGGMVLHAVVQEPQNYDTPPDDGFRDFVDVAAIAIPLALIALVTAMLWPSAKRWFRHRMRRHRRRKRRAAITNNQSPTTSHQPPN